MDNIKHQLKFSPQKVGHFPFQNTWPLLFQYLPGITGIKQNSFFLLVLYIGNTLKAECSQNKCPLSSTSVGPLISQWPHSSDVILHNNGNWNLQCHEWSRRGRNSHLHIQDPMSTCAPGAQGHAGQNCQTPKKRLLFGHSCFW